MSWLKVACCRFASDHQQLSTCNFQLSTKKNNACKPSSVSRFRELPSFIYATYPPGPDGPSSSAEEKKTSAHSRFTWSYSPQGLSEPTGYPRCWWSLTPPFHPYPVCTWRFKFLQHYLSLCGFSHKAPAFHRVRCPLQPGLSSPHKAERWNGVVCDKYRK